MSQIESYCQYQNGTDSYGKLLLTVSGTDSHTENYQSLFRQIQNDIIDKNNNVCFEDLDILVSHLFLSDLLKI